MADSRSNKMDTLRWLSTEIYNTWRRSQDPQEIHDLLPCVTGFDRHVVLGSLFWTGLTDVDWKLAGICLAEGYPLNPIDLSDWGPMHYLISLIGDRPDIAEWLIEHGVDIERRGPSNRTPLHSASAACFAGVARVLVDSGANVNARTEIDDNDTPLMLAVLAHCPQGVELLLANGADPTLCDAQGRTAKELADKSQDPVILRILSTK